MKSILLKNAVENVLSYNRKNHIQLFVKPIKENDEIIFSFIFKSCDVKGCRSEDIKKIIDDTFCESLMYVSETKTTLTYTM